MARAEWAMWLLALSRKTDILAIEHIVTHKTRAFILSGPSLFENDIEALLGEEPGLELVGGETDLGQAVERIRDCHPDVVVLTDGEGGRGLDGELLRLVRECLPIRMVEVHLGTNTVCIYCGEQQSIREVGDLVRTVQNICDGLSREVEVPLAQTMGPHD